MSMEIQRGCAHVLSGKSYEELVRKRFSEEGSSKQNVELGDPQEVGAVRLL